ncbi:MAG: hypothetical protein ACREP7_14575 [Lysobacter sp.]
MRDGYASRPIPMARFVAIALFAALACVVLIAGGCSRKSRVKVPTYKQNQKPAQIFDLTVTVDKAPGPFAVVEGSMQYDITNRDCLPPAESFSGVQTTPISTFLPIALKKIGDNTYQGRVALDGLIDDDYFGHGICHFKAIGPSVGFSATSAAGETRFYASRYADEMSVTRDKTSHYWKGTYPRQREIDDYPDHGSDSPEEFKESIRSELFSITIKVEKVLT